MQKRKTDPESGFTLVELMVTVAIIALVAGLTFAELSSSGYRLKTTAKTLKAGMQRAHLLAIKNSTPVTIDFDFDGDGVAGDGTIDKGYTIWQDLNQNGTCDDATTDNNGDGTIDALDEELIETITLPGDIAFGTVAAGDGGPTAPSDVVTYGSHQLKFNSRGTSSSGYAYLYSPNNDSAGSHQVGTNNLGRVRSRYYVTDGGEWR